ncbi:MAG: undecaprenyl-diphosphate phosphatase [Bacteroidales bacterium]|jgi:undecaprenyl-diphosphatase|nr:undecaprenyl-diphosphate phosphatase [Bacteroidales bacterium]
MSWLEALILGLVQGLTEFLPVSSSGHLEIGKTLLGITLADDLTFTVVVHGATVLSTIVVFWQEIAKLFGGMFKFKWNAETQYVAMIIVSMIPVAILGFGFKDQVESLFSGGLWIVGGALLLTAVLLTFANYAKDRNRDITFRDAFIIGCAQAVAVIPGLSRSGTTIATGLLLGNKRAAVAQFSFLMILIPILGENVLDLIKMMSGETLSGGMSALPLVVGGCAAFVSGLLACRFMVNLVKKGKLIYFAIYCVLAAIVAFAL